MENSVTVPQKIKNIVTVWPSNLSCGYLPNKLENIYLQSYMYLYVHCSIICGGQGMEMTKVSLDRELGKEDVLHVYYGTPLSHTERWNTAISNNMDRPWEYYAKLNNSVRKAKNHMISLICGI